MNAIYHIFPDSILSHILTFADGSRVNLLVAPSETYGHALRRAGYNPDHIESIELPDAPMHYEPDHASATR